jgi:hypothetical protein
LNVATVIAETIAQGDGVHASIKQIRNETRAQTSPAMLILTERRFAIGLSRLEIWAVLAVFPSKAGWKPALRT